MQSRIVKFTMKNEIRGDSGSSSADLALELDSRLI